MIPMTVKPPSPRSGERKIVHDARFKRSVSRFITPCRRVGNLNIKHCITIIITYHYKTLFYKINTKFNKIDKKV